MPRLTAKSLENETTTNEYNPFAEATTVQGTVRSERNVFSDENSYTEVIKKRKSDNNEIYHTQV